MSKLKISQSDILKAHKAQLEKVKEIFLKHDGKISLSMDLQKDMVKFEDYVCVCAHFIDEDWKLRKWLTKYCGWLTFESDHPTTVITKSLNEYDIERKLLTLTLVDDADVMADEVKEQVETKTELPLPAGQFFRVQSCSDLICKMVQAGFEEIDRIVSKVQMLSWSNSLPLWHLTAHKLSNALQLEEMGEFSSVEEGGFYEVPSTEEWEKVRIMCRISDKIYEITEGLFRLNNPTSNLFLPPLQEIRSFLTQESASPDAFVKLMALKMLKIFNKYWDSMYLLLSIAAFLDPRCKMEFVESCLSDNDSRATIVSNTIRQFYNDNYVVRCDRMEPSLAGSRSEVEAMQIVDDASENMDLDLYLEEPALPWRANFSVLQWWKDNCSKYPRLSRMARDFLAIPMSLASSFEASYNIEPREADRTVLSCNPEVMNALKCIRSWKLDLTN